MSVALYSSLLQNSFVATRSPDTSGHELIQFIELTRMMPVGSAQPANQCAICLHFSFIVTNSVWNPVWDVLMSALVSFRARKPGCKLVIRASVWGAKSSVNHVLATHIRHHHNARNFSVFIFKSRKNGVL